MTAQLFIQNDSGVQIFPDPRPKVAMLAKNSTPAGTIFTAVGSDGTTYAFGYPQTPSGYGMSLFGESGELLFDAVTYGRMARPVGQFTGIFPPNVSSQSWSQTFPSGRTYAVAMMENLSPFNITNVSVVIGGVTNYFYVFSDQETAVSFSGSTITVNATRSPQGGNQGGSPTPYEEAGHFRFRAVVLDVTNF